MGVVLRMSGLVAAQSLDKRNADRNIRDVLHISRRIDEHTARHVP